MIPNPNNEHPYRLFLDFTLRLLDAIAAGRIGDAEAMIDVEDPGLLRHRLELGLEEGTKFQSPLDGKNFTLYFYNKGLHRGFDFGVEFYISNSVMEYETKLEFEAVGGGYRVHLVSL
jgi:hypothetical protein